MLRHWCAVIADRDGVVRGAADDWEKHWCATSMLICSFLSWLFLGIRVFAFFRNTVGAKG
jgi:hypothetical protein